MCLWRLKDISHSHQVSNNYTDVSTHTYSHTHVYASIGVCVCHFDNWWICGSCLVSAICVITCRLCNEAQTIMLVSPGRGNYRVHFYCILNYLHECLTVHTYLHTNMYACVGFVRMHVHVTQTFFICLPICPPGIYGQSD